MRKTNLSDEEARDCGLGEGRQCCAYLALRGGTFRCIQHDELLAAIVQGRVAAGTMGAKRLPKGEFPECQKEGRG